MIRVVVVDDSAFMRKALATMLDKDDGISVVATARNGQEGLDAIRQHNPDVVTMDIEMPVMDGLTALRHIMMENPKPVLMISSLTTEGAESTLKAMELGAVDFIPKQLSKVSLDIIKIEEDLRCKVKEIASRKVLHKALTRRHAQRPTARPSEPVQERLATPSGRAVRSVVAIGVSTGGPPAVQRILSSLPQDFPASILVAQHMPAAFTGPFAARLDNLSPLTVKEAQGRESLRPGHVYIAPGGRHIMLEQSGSRLDVVVSDEPADALYKPSADVLIDSVARTLGAKSLGVILTGMGNDGAKGVQALKDKGGKAIAQSDASCVVYGMPKAIVDAGLSDRVVDIDDMARNILQMVYEP